MIVAVATFALAAVLIVLLPGPDTLVVVRNLLRGGKRQGVLTALGNLCGLVIWVGAAALGLAALLRASEVGYDVLRVAGAIYLVTLGVQAWRSRGVEKLAGEPAAPSADASGAPSAEPPASASGRRSLVGSGFGAGLLTNLLNPKVGVFFVTFLPGFVPHGYPVGGTTLLLGAIFVVITAAYWVVLVGLAARVTDWMSRPRIRRRLDMITGTILIGFGVRLVTE